MIEINLLPQELKTKTKAKKPGVTGIEPKYFLLLLPIAFMLLLLAHIYLGAVTLLKNNALGRLNKKWVALAAQRKELEEFNKEYSLFSEDAATIKQLVAARINWAPKLNKLSLNLPSGIWFNELTVSAKELLISGSVISLQKDELGLVNQFIDKLKLDSTFFKDFTNMELGSVQRKSVGGYEIIDFNLIATLKSK